MSLASASQMNIAQIIVVYMCCLLHNENQPFKRIGPIRLNVWKRVELLSTG